MSYDFNGYEKVDQMVGYVGYISPEGLIYRVREYGKENVCMHSVWCQEFLKQYNINMSPLEAWKYVLYTLRFMLVCEYRNSYKNLAIQSTDKQIKQYKQLVERCG